MSADRLARFKTAQYGAAGFDTAISELASGRKRSHWIWYIFPQLAGLGRSELAREYGVDGLSEAAEYLRDPLLRERLLTATRTVETQLRQGNTLEHLMGSTIDVVKLVSSLTLFGRLARTLHTDARLSGLQQLADAADAVLAAANGEGYSPCEYTLAHFQH